MVAPKVRFTVAPRVVVASLERKGPYSGIVESMRALKEWTDSEGIKQAGYPFCLFYDNPSETPQSELRSEACIPVLGPFDSEGKYKMKEFPEAEVAETRHRGPPEEFASTYGPFLEGLLGRGYEILGPAREYFTSIPDIRGPGSGFLIQQPIRRK